MDTYAFTLIATDEPFVSIIVLATVHYFTLTVWRISLDGFYIAGVAASSRKFCVATDTDAAGVVFLE